VLDHRLDARLANGDQGELGGYEQTVEAYENRQAQESQQGPPELTVAGCLREQMRHVPLTS
jgi:hypothetical protein